MKGYQFYEEFESSYKKRKHQGSGNVLALDIDTNGRPLYSYGGNMECTAALLSEPDSPVCGTQVSRQVLAKNYCRITEKRAREIHPEMFQFLDQFDSEGSLKSEGDICADWGPVMTQSFAEWTTYSTSEGGRNARLINYSEWSQSQPWASYLNGIASRNFATLEDGLEHFRRMGLKLELQGSNQS